MIDLPDLGSAPPGVRRPTFEVKVGTGGDAGGLGGLAGAATSALGVGGSEDPWRRSVASIRLDAGVAPTADALEILMAGDSQAPTVAVGDELTVSLGYEDAETVDVFTGAIDRIRRRIDGTVLVGASNGGSVLARLRLNQSFEQQTAGDVVRDLAGRVEVGAGTIEDGIELAFIAVDDRRSGLVHIAELARRCGFVAAFGPDGKLGFAPPPSGSPVKTFSYAVDVLGLEVLEATPELGAVTTVGDGAAGSEGTDAWAWLIKDPGSVTGSAGSGAPERSFSDGALRSGDAASGAATAIAGASAARAKTGRLTVPGAPEVHVGALIEVSGAADSLNGQYLVTRVRHRYEKRGGFTSELMLAQAGAGGGLLGALGGLL